MSWRERLGRILQATGWSYRQAGRAMTVGHSTIGAIMTGRNVRPALHLRAAIKRQERRLFVPVVLPPPLVALSHRDGLREATARYVIGESVVGFAIGVGQTEHLAIRSALRELRHCGTGAGA